MTESRVAGAVGLQREGASLRVGALAELLAAAGSANAALAASYDGLAEPPVDPMMLNDADLADADALDSLLGTLRERDALPRDAPEGPDALPRDAPEGPDALPRDAPDDPEARVLVERADCGPPPYVEVIGGPTLVLVLWLLTTLDGTYKVTEEYALGGPPGRNVQKRVSFNTTASLPELAGALREPFD